MIPSSDLQTCLQVLRTLSRNPELAADQEELKTLISKINKQARKALRKKAARQKVEQDKEIKSKTWMHQHNAYDSKPLTQIPNTVQEEGEQEAPRLQNPQTCYSCKKDFHKVHHFYHLLCPECAIVNYIKRSQNTNLKGRVALITGGRIKIGFHLALKMLRDGGEVIVTTRFPKNAAKNYAKEPDFDQWAERLHICQVDFRDIPATEEWLSQIQQSFKHIDIIVNNAAQTIKRPNSFYEHLLPQEQTDIKTLPLNQQKLLLSPASSLVVTPSPPFNSSHLVLRTSHLLDKDGQAPDYRPQNSWTLKLENIETVEFLEVQLVNVIAPFLINKALYPLLLKSPHSRKFIINVSAMEGQFNRASKTAFHPHTNMAKAALNMMTRTTAQDYAKLGIFMTSVDTGWITEENPWDKKVKIKERGFVPPLDVIDGAARLYDPIVRGLTEEREPYFGVFLKDYLPHEW